MTLLTETRERFLLKIVAQVPAERIVEIHFFQPIKQGGVESGVAVVAAWPEVPAIEESAVLESTEATELQASIESAESAEAIEGAPSIDSIPTVEVVIEGVEASASEATTTDTVDDGVDAVVDDSVDDGFEEDAAVSIDAESIASDPSPDEATVPTPLTRAESAAKGRHTIYTARYRLTLKGPDRGKWESLVVAEADAPLVTVDAVVRGVQRRSGDVDDATRLEGDDVRALIEAKRAATPGAR